MPSSTSPAATAGIAAKVAGDGDEGCQAGNAAATRTRAALAVAAVAWNWLIAGDPEAGGALGVTQKAAAAATAAASIPAAASRLPTMPIIMRAPAVS